MARLRIIEILGGPLDGKRVAWDCDVECMAWTDGTRLYEHSVYEIWTGKRMRTVLRHIGTIPMPSRDR